MASFLEVNAIITTSDKVRIPLFRNVVDGYTDETHELGVTKSNLPLENGAEITDNAVQRPERFVTGGVVTTQLGLTRPREAWDKFREVERSAEPVRVLTYFGDYPEMIIERLVATRVGQGMLFTMTMGAVIRVGTQVDILGFLTSGPAFQRTAEVIRGRIAGTPLGNVLGSLL